MGTFYIILYPSVGVLGVYFFGTLILWRSPIVHEKKEQKDFEYLVASFGLRNAVWRQ
jgi:hypothetical protein